MRRAGFATFAIVLVGYAIGAEASWRWFGAVDQGMAFYPAAGVTLAALLLTDRRRWVVVLAAAATAEMGVSTMNGVTPAIALGYTIANLVEPLAGATVIQRSVAVRAQGLDLERRAPALAFVMGALVVGPVVGGAIGSVVKWVELGESVPLSWVSWWAGDALGVLVVALPVLMWFGGPTRPRWDWELVLGTVLVVPLSVAVFLWLELAPTLLVLPVLAWAVHRFSVFGVAVVAPVLSVIANIATAQGNGAFTDSIFDQEQVALLFTQIYLLLSLCAAWAIAISLLEREGLARSLLAREVAAANLRQIEALAREMQTALLATPDDIPAISLATRYVAAQDGLRVGGDWYDAIDAPGGAVLVIGDAVGHGLAATTAMGQLRSATRAAALASADPAQVLAVLDRFATVVPDAQSTTMAVVVIDAEGDRATYACAGHLPPLLVPPTGPVVWLDQALTPPLGCGSGRPRTSASVALEPGDRFVLYTDGLIERRGELIDEGLGRLGQAVDRGRPGGTVEELVDRLLDRCGGDGHLDDVAILVAEVVDGRPAGARPGDPPA